MSETHRVLIGCAFALAWGIFCMAVCARGMASQAQKRHADEDGL